MFFNSKKRKRDSEYLNYNPVVWCIEELIGKKVEHVTFECYGNGKWFKGVVICQKPESQSELVIRYDCEKKFYSFSFTNFLNGDVKLVPVTCNYLTGKNIRQRFTNGSEEDSWWEAGLWQVMDCDSQGISGDFTVNFFDKSDSAELDEALFMKFWGSRW